MAAQEDEGDDREDEEDERGDEDAVEAERLGGDAGDERAPDLAETQEHRVEAHDRAAVVDLRPDDERRALVQLTDFGRQVLRDVYHLSRDHPPEAEDRQECGDA